ncbi:hypothetical protein ABPG75_007368 [Micractinium tetrahymenae]
MAQFTGPSIADLPGWRIGLIFLLFCIIAIAYDYGAEALDRYLKRHGKRALRHVVRRLQGELLVLGLLSLLLVAFESYLLRICIPCSGDACAWGCPEPPYVEQGQAGSSGAGGHRRLRTLQAAWAGAGGGRGLLASGATGQLGCLQAEETCGLGSEPFWSQLAIVQAHLFLFVIAVVHILYACISMLLCLWKLRRWRRYEEAAREQPLRPLHSRFLPRPGDHALAHFLRCTASMLADSVNGDVYASLRRLFIERLDVHPAFNFHEFLVESMEEEFAGIVGVSSVLWCILLLWIMLPPASYQMVWLPALAVSAGFVVAVKLQSIIICLAEDAYQLYGLCSGEGSTKLGLVQATTLLSESTASPSSGEDLGDEAEEEAGEEEGVAHALASAGAPPEQAAVLAAAARASAQQAAKAEAAGLVRRTSQADGSDKTGEPGGEAAGQSGQVDVQQQQEQVEQALGRELSVDLEAQQQPEQAARAAADAAHAAHPPSSVFRRCCPWLLPRLPWHGPQRRQRVVQAVARSQSFSEGYRGPDAAGLFWFGRPRLMLRIIQGIYFENSLSVAAVLFSLWQGIEFDWSRYGGWAFLVSMIVVQLLVLLFMSLTVLPVYALTTAAGSHSAASVIQLALKRNIKPDVARALQRMSLNLPATPEEDSDHGAGPATQQHTAPAAPASAASAPERPGQAAPAPGTDAALLAQVPRVPPVWGPPSLGRHSAPLPGLLHRLSPAWPFPAPSGGSMAGNALLAAQAQAGAADSLASPFGSVQLDPGSWPEGAETPSSQPSGAASVVDAAALAAAAAAAAVGPPGWEEDKRQRSITRLMGAMLQRQLQRQLERAPSAASGRSLQRPSGALSSGSAGSGARHASLAVPSGMREVQEHPGTVETCPAAVGATWLPQLMQQLDAGRAGSAATAAAVPSEGLCHSNDASACRPRQMAGGVGTGKGSQPQVVCNGSDSAARPTLAQVRGLFEAGAAEAAQLKLSSGMHPAVEH